VLMAARLNYQRAADPDDDATDDAAADVSPATWALLRHFVDLAAAHWQEPDRGIWEIRGAPQDFVYSKLMCWAAVDSGIRLARDRALEAPLHHWRQVRAAIRQTILERGYDPGRGAFTQAFGSTALDASVLIIPRIGFLPATDPRVGSTIDAVQSHLTRDGWVDRYHTPDGLPGGEASFALCTLWLVDALALRGRLDEAHALFEQVAGCANDVGLLSEEIAPEHGLLLGNFPQGFTHLALVRAAVNLAKVAKHGPEHRAETEAQRAGPAQRAAAEGATGRRAV
jgi:GH15 family glucan-1,4-alpha-glucosidase